MIACVSVYVLIVISVAASEELAPLPIKLPAPAFGSYIVKLDPSIDSPTGKARPAPLAPKDVTNIGLHKGVVSSAPALTGSLDQIVDGVRDLRSDCTVEFRSNLQWIQIDLGAKKQLYYILFWRQTDEMVAYHDVIVRASNDPRFVKGVTTLFNNDQNNSAGFGKGEDREYYETYEGKLVDAKSVNARYIRIYSAGNSHDQFNRCTEIEVWGRPAK